VSATPLDSVRAVRRKLRRLEPLIPVALFVAPFGAGGALVAAVHANSALLIALTTALLIASFSSLVAWVLISDRRATHSPRHVPLAEKNWKEFERSFWAHVTRRSDVPPPRTGAGDEG